MKTYYQLFGIEPDADIEAVKKAFRREIAKYHPDKVTHLAPEFQDLATVRASELTEAYKILSDPELRAEYNESLKAEPTPPAPPPEPVEDKEPPKAKEEETEEEGEPTIDPDIDHGILTPQPFPRGGRAAEEQREKGHKTTFREERVGRDDILRRATMFKLHEALRHVLGECDAPVLRGFDIACVPRRKQGSSFGASIFGQKPPETVLVRMVSRVDAEAVAVAYRQAHMARIETNSDAVIVLVVGNHLATGSELARAIEAVRKELPRSLDKIFLVPVDGRDWTAKIPVKAPDAIRTLIERLKMSI